MINYIKWGAIGIAVIVVGYMAWNYHVAIRDAAELKTKVLAQEATISNKNKQISDLEKTRELADKTMKERDEQIELLNSELKDLTDNLGDDIDNDAPNSLKELVRRLKK